MAGKLLIATRADSGIKEMCEITHPFLIKYAEKCKADFLIMDHDSGIDAHPYHYRIMKFKELFEEYDRIMSIDSDVLISNKCPDVFGVVPETHVGTVFEDKGTRLHARLRIMEKAQERYGDIGWKRNYMNTGFAVFSRCHKDIFEPINGEYWDGWGQDDVHLMYNIKKAGHPILELLYKYNHMTLFSEPWNGSPNRFDSYCIHYAGEGIFLRKFRGNRLKQIRHDAIKMKENGLA